MELIQTTESIAKEILESKKRIIKAKKDESIYNVIWINENNHTCGLSSRKGHEYMQNSEDIIFFIQVPANAKTIY